MAKITVNPDKSTLITRTNDQVKSIVFNNTQIQSITQMQAFRFLECWFTIYPKKTAVYKIITDEIAEAIKCLKKVRITEKQAAYIINHVILTRVEYQIQSAILSEATADKYTKKCISIVKQKAGLAKSVSNSTVLHYNIYSLRSIQNIQI